MSEPPSPTPAGELLRRVRELTVPKLSRPEVAHRAGIDPGTLGNIERGYRFIGEGNVRVVAGDAAIIAKVARVLGIPPDRLEKDGQRADAAMALRELLSGQSGRPVVQAVPDLTGPGEPDPQAGLSPGARAVLEQVEAVERLWEADGKPGSPPAEDIFRLKGEQALWMARNPTREQKAEDIAGYRQHIAMRMQENGNPGTGTGLPAGEQSGNERRVTVNPLTVSRDA